METISYEQAKESEAYLCDVGVMGDCNLLKDPWYSAMRINCYIIDMEILHSKDSIKIQNHIKTLEKWFRQEGMLVSR